MVKINKTSDSSCWHRCRKENTHPLLMGVQTCTVTMEISVAVHQKDTNQSTLRPSYTTLGHIPKRYFILPQKQLFTAGLFIIARIGSTLDVPQWMGG